VSVWLLSSDGQSFQTERAERREIVLRDGSVVQLDPETRMLFKLEAHERDVTLLEGRALFHVAQDALRPFRVKADQTFVQAVGTAFGVEKRDRRVVVTVAEGKVAVTSEAHPSGSAGGTLSVSETNARITLVAGQQVTVPQSGKAAPVRAVDAGRALAWAQGRLVFENETLANVVAEFNRYNPVQLSISDPELASRRVNGVFAATDVETLLAFIQAGNHVRILHAGVQRLVIAPAQ